MAKKDYYKILGVDRKASKADIKKAFRKLAKKHHPDRNKGDAEAEQRFKEISEAHSVLTDDEKRRNYDLMGDAAAHGQAGPDFWENIMGGAGRRGGGRRRTQNIRYEDLGDMGDLFSQFFTADSSAQGRPGARTRPQRGENVVSRVRIPFDLAARGGKIKVKVPVDQACGVCSGSGAAKDGRQACPTCGGSGQAQSNMGGFAFARPCPQCMGRGQIVTKPCAACGGSGQQRQWRNFRVSIPPGVKEGQRIRLRGQGGQSPTGGPPGDVLVEVHIQPSKSFRREGNDVYSEATVNVVQAALGTTVEVDTLQGKAKVKVPQGTSSGARLRLKGKGIEASDGTRGDHYVEIKVTTPKKLTEEQRKLLQQFADASDLQR